VCVCVGGWVCLLYILPMYMVILLDMTCDDYDDTPKPDDCATLTQHQSHNIISSLQHNERANIVLYTLHRTGRHIRRTRGRNSLYDNYYGFIIIYTLHVVRHETIREI